MDREALDLRPAHEQAFHAEVIAQEIADDLEAALEQFATIAEDLRG